MGCSPVVVGFCTLLPAFVCAADQATETPVTLYKIPIMCLAGQIGHDKGNVSSVGASKQTQHHTMLSPLVNPIDCSNPDTIAGRRSPLLRHTEDHTDTVHAIEVQQEGSEDPDKLKTDPDTLTADPDRLTADPDSFPDKALLTAVLTAAEATV